MLQTVGEGCQQNWYHWMSKLNNPMNECPMLNIYNIITKNINVKFLMSNPIYCCDILEFWKTFGNVGFNTTQNDKFEFENYFALEKY